ncbi:hypothetical protein FGO68_gene6605 [Halteria grandinella]|uniref:Uncharacterized protein n=1 Tax=Halteria grandinella TaxID=5974 RepID=A0A8J8NL71_HALGN|nr:hypothetical protein FGO68_gene6605 [Halteria grandinella]
MFCQKSSITTNDGHTYQKTQNIMDIQVIFFGDSQYTHEALQKFKSCLSSLSDQLIGTVYDLEPEIEEDDFQLALRQVLYKGLLRQDHENERCVYFPFRASEQSGAIIEFAKLSLQWCSEKGKEQGFSDGMKFITKNYSTEAQGEILIYDHQDRRNLQTVRKYLKRNIPRNPHTHFYLVGAALSVNPEKEEVSYSEGMSMAYELGATDYMHIDINNELNIEQLVRFISQNMHKEVKEVWKIDSSIKWKVAFVLILFSMFQEFQLIVLSLPILLLSLGLLQVISIAKVKFFS